MKRRFREGVSTSSSTRFCHVTISSVRSILFTWVMCHKVYFRSGITYENFSASWQWIHIWWFDLSSSETSTNRLQTKISVFTRTTKDTQLNVWRPLTTVTQKHYRRTKNVSISVRLQSVVFRIPPASVPVNVIFYWVNVIYLGIVNSVEHSYKITVTRKFLSPLQRKKIFIYPTSV